MIRFFSTLIVLLTTTFVFAQKPLFQGHPLKDGSQRELADQFYEWEVYQIDAQKLDEFVKKAGDESNFIFEMGEHHWDIQLQKRDLRSSKYVSSVLTDKGIERSSAFDGTMTYRGQLPNVPGWSVALTLNEGFIYGFFQEGEETYFIEPLWYFVPGQPKDKFVVYAASAVRPEASRKCGVEEMHDRMGTLHPEELKKQKEHEDGAEKMMGCVSLELSIAADRSMFNAHGSIPGVNGFTFGVMNNVQTNYDNEFNDEINFVIVEQFVVAPPAMDPWTSSTDAGALLDDFTDWGPGGFFSDHDLGQLWTNRDLAGGTVGIAWLCAVCSGARYHVVSEFTSNAAFLRVMTAHEIGHNFCAEHDASGSPFIMAPAVSAATAWSPASLADINSFYPSRSCLSGCAGSQPPVASFSADPTNGCTPHTVEFTDLSTNNPVSWNWSFPGGTPSTSTQQNPVVVYHSPGVFNVTLTVTNGVGSNTITQTNVINVLASPLASFTSDKTNLTVIFTNTSSFGLDYFWDFGDGSNSTETNPIHTYTTDGFYDVTLTVSNNCGSDIFTNTIPVFIAPIAEFSSSATSGCPPLTISFFDQSTPNTINWNWSFPGGTPNSSTQQFPAITYSTPGVYTVTLVASNPAGTDTEVKTSYITIGGAPTSNFTSVVNGTTVTFTNTATNPPGSGPLQYSWDFGDSNSSILPNPTHTYAAGGNYNVVLTVTNLCGSTSSTHVVTIAAAPIAGFGSNVTSGCTPLTVNFTSTSQGASTYSWSFPGGTPSSSTVQNPTVTYNTAGTYNVTLMVTNATGSDTLVQTNYITVAPAATAGFTNSVSGFTATFTNTSSNATSYTWNFGDGNTSTQANPSHTYAADGTYTVVLSATNACGTVTSTQSVVIVTLPTAAFSANPTSGCWPLSVQFTNQSSANATSYAWSFPGGTPLTSTAQNPVVVYNAAGTYAVILTVTNAAGSNTSNQMNYITVYAAATAGFTTSLNGTTATFTNTSNGAVSYAWNFGDGGTSTATNPSHTYATDGTYTVVLSATNPCGTVTSTQTVVIVTPPSSAFTATNTSGCGPLTVQYTNQSSANATSYAWSFPGGDPSTSTAQNPTVNYATPGNYDATLIVTNSAGADTTTLTNFVNVQAAPAASFSVASNVWVANFTNTTTNATSYAWNFGDGGTSTDTNPTHSYTADGTYAVTLIATGTCGSDTTTQQVVITSLPVAGFSADSTSGCSPFTVQFQDQSSSNTTSWSWSFPGGTPATSSAQNPTVTYSAPGTYSVSLTATNALGQNTATQTDYITVGAAATAGFTSSTNLLTATFTNTSTNATSYVWNFGDGSPTSTEANPTHTYATDGNYTVTLTATNACGSVNSTQTVAVATLPTAGFTADVTVGCAPLTVQFTNQSSANATSYVWSFPGGTPSSSTAQNPTVVYNTGGTYTVTLTVSNVAGQNTATQTNYIVVNAAPSASFTGSVSGTTVTFNNTTTNATSYVWNFGDGSATSTEASPTHTYTTDGIYDVTLTATNSCGSTTVNGQFTIVTSPTAGFSASASHGCAPFEVTFNNESSDNAASFAWSFPGGTPATSTEENPTVTYNAPGTYSVTLTVTNAAGSDTETLTNVVTATGAPVASFSYSTSGAVVAFTNTTTNATSYVWDFGDGSETSTEANPTHSYASNGVYTVTLTAINECGETEVTQTVVYSSSGAPVAFFTAEGNTGCAPLTITFNNESENATSFLWNFPGGTPSTSTQENPTIVYNTPGTFDVSLTVTNLQGTNTYSQPGFVVVGAVPTPSFTTTANANVVTFTNTSTNGTSYVWDFGDGTATSTETNPTHTYATGGQYDVTLTATNTCGSKTTTIEITVMANGVGEIPGISRFDVFPNPNSGNFTLVMEGTPQTDLLELSFTNVLGQRLLSQKADFRTGRLTKDFTFSQLAAGVYILQVKSGEKAMFRKLVIE